MHVKYLAGTVSVALLAAGCSSGSELSSVGQSVRFIEDKPGAECQLIDTAIGKQSSWFSGQHDEEGGSMRSAANGLRSQAAVMGGNVIYGVSSSSQGMLSSFVPTISEMIGQVYKCPNWELLLMSDDDARAPYPTYGTNDRRPDKRSTIRYSGSYVQTERVSDAMRADTDPD